MSETESLPIAAIVLDGSGGDILATFVAEVVGQGVRVRGLIQQHLPELCLVDVHSGQVYPITQDLGPQATGCRIDPGGFAAAAMVLRRALDDAELVVVNRFGRLEAEGGGLVAEMLAVMAEGVPVLTCVNVDQLAAWQRFTGGAGVLLPADPAALRQWWHDILGPRA